MMKRSSLAVVIAASLTGLVQAQEASGTASVGTSLTVPQAKAGECQALIIVPAKFEPKVEQVIVKEASETIEIVPAEYEWVEKEVMVKPAGERLEIIPATYKTVEEEIEVEPKTVEKEVIEPQFAEINEEIVSKPAYMSAFSEGSNREFASVSEVMRLAEVPQANTTITKKVVQEAVQVKETPVESQFVTIETQVIDQPAEVKKVPFEAEYETVRVKQLVKEAEEVRREIPAEYAEVTVYDKIADAQMRWESVLCENSVNQSTIEEVQKALNEAGYNAGGIDGALGPSTTRALEQYQRDNGLGVGGVTMETLEALGISQ
ncbi:peptidoglycan-binding protein [Suttonella sp. R2A3]|uniref:peptidoglycan-binding domain-containing protein n=1 Tax=Suttonella sp. R2A3 TaxID=2908648 RepID=UPI001F3808BB|nr:peptidoglycan-binding domain-containing protein [Suttonella sp. R2A3]UJF25243.1 peptidoglycan-binding protein [Suttonella sp. R2A3]